MRPSFRKMLQGPFRALCVILLLVFANAAAAQQLGVPQSGVLTISSDRFFSESAYGQRVFREVEAESALLAKENERIVSELSTEEKDLTEKRANMSIEDFRPLAEAFDKKVQNHRESQRAKLDLLAQKSEEARDRFFEFAQPVLVELLRDRSASIIIERSNVFLSSDVSDITDAAIERMNATIGDGQTLETNDGD